MATLRRIGRSFNPGDLKHKITIQTGTEARGASGSSTLSYSGGSITWAAIMPGRGWEKYEDESVKSEGTVIFRVRHRKTKPTTADRIVFDGRTFNINAPPVNVDELNIYLDIKTREVV